MTRSAAAGSSVTPEALEKRPGTEAGLSGPWSVSIVTSSDARVREETERLLDRAREIRPILRAAQAQTEEDGHYSAEVHQYFVEHGFYRMLMPTRFGGLQVGVNAFYQVIAEIGRGCPSTAWCLSLSSGHSLTLASYWPEEAQREVFSELGYMVAPASGNGMDVNATREGDGWRISGTWRYCSGAPWSTHFFPSLELPDANGDQQRYWLVMSRDQYEVLDDWGQSIGMRGSGSNSIRVVDAFVPDVRIVQEDWTLEVFGPTPGSALHGDGVYGGSFEGFAEGEVASAIVGLGYAALDEYERIIVNTRAPWRPDGSKRVDHPDWRRSFGVAMGWVDSAAAILGQSSRLYEEYARRSANSEEPFTFARTSRLANTYYVVERLVWDAVELMLRTAGSSASADGQRLQRYFRDMVTTRTRADQFDFAADRTILAYLEDRSTE